MNSDRGYQTYRDRKLLARLYPACFVMPKTKAPKRPLRIGIEHELMRRGGLVTDAGVVIGMNRLKRALSDYCSGRRYQEGLIREDVRIDLDGNPYGDVAPEAKEFARKHLERMDQAKTARTQMVAA